MTRNCLSSGLNNSFFARGRRDIHVLNFLEIATSSYSF